MKVNSTLIASLQGSVTGGQELEVPDALLPVIALPLPLAGVQQAVPVELRNVPNSIHLFNVINQAINSGITTNQLATLDRGIYRITGQMMAAFLGFTLTAADPFGCVLQLLAPGGASAITIAVTPQHNPAASASPTLIVPFDYTYQLTQPGFVLQWSTFHNTGAAQTIGAAVSVQVNRLM
jgi:hypothetical protein